MSGTDQLPEEWERVALEELATWRGGGTPSKRNAAYWEGGSIPWVSPKDMKQDEIWRAQDTITHEALELSAARLIPANSVLIVVRSGILKHTLPVAVNRVAVCVNQDMKALTPGPAISAEYLALTLRRYAREILHKASKTGTTVTSIVTDRLLGFTIPVPPRERQDEIMEKVASHLSRADATASTVERLVKNLDRYRRAILEAACRGELT